MCRYNNLTYRVDNIEWDMSPMDRFEYKGEQISYIEYFKNVRLKLLIEYAVVV